MKFMNIIDSMGKVKYNTHPGASDLMNINTNSPIPNKPSHHSNAYLPTYLSVN